jgi:ribosomal protein L11 methyltransferase
LSVRVQPGSVEFAADLLQELTGNGVTIEPPIQALGPDEGYVLDEAAPVRIVAYVRGTLTEDERAAYREAFEAAGLTGAISDSFAWGTIREEDWAENWKQHYDIERVGRLVVRPAWREYEPRPGDVVISLDPGMAFGTGQHPTTRMCLAAMQERGPLSRVLDLGCGSGILAIAAIALGAESVLATDTEDQAVSATIANVALNGMQDRIETRAGSIDVVQNEGPFDCILANINAAAVTALAAAMAAEMKPGGWLAAGGVIAEREAGARAALEAAGMRIEETMATGDWRTFIARR